MRITDEDIARNCLNALRAYSSVPDQKLKLVVNSGWVTVEGTVEWQYQKTAAENAMRYRIGVRGISNNINVKPRPSAADAIPDRRASPGPPRARKTCAPLKVVYGTQYALQARDADRASPR